MTAPPLRPDDVALVAAWPTRADTPTEIAERLSLVLQAINTRDPEVTAWKRNRGKASAASTHVSGLADLVERGAVKDSSRPPRHITAIGYLLWLYPVGGARGVEVMISAGQRLDTAISTCCVRIQARAAQFRTTEVARELLRAMIDAFDPEWASWTARPLADLEHLTPDGRAIGHLNYGPLAQMRELDPLAQPYRGGAIAQLGDDAELADPDEALRLLRLVTDHDPEPGPELTTDPDHDPEPDPELTTDPPEAEKLVALLPIGQDLGARRVFDGTTVQDLEDHAYRVWRAAHGDLLATAAVWGPDQTITAAHRVGVDQAAGVLGTLRARGLVTEVVIGTEDAIRFARRHRLEARMQVLGPSRDSTGGALLGVPDHPMTELTADSANVYLYAPTYDDLWSTCEAVATQTPTRQHGQVPIAYMLAELFLLESRMMLAAGAGFFLPVRIPGRLPDRDNRTEGAP